MARGLGFLGVSRGFSAFGLGGLGHLGFKGYAPAGFGLRGFGAFAIRSGIN